MNDFPNKRDPESHFDSSQLKLFHRILCRFESETIPKAVKDFRSMEINQLMTKFQTSKVKKLLLDRPFDLDEELHLSELMFNNNGTKAYQLISNLRHAFAHNRIWIDSNNPNILKIENVYNKEVCMRGLVRFDVLKELIETILGDHNLSEKEKKNLRKQAKHKKIKQKRK